VKLPSSAATSEGNPRFVDQMMAAVPSFPPWRHHLLSCASARWTSGWIGGVEFRVGASATTTMVKSVSLVAARPC
jgi:hypothetical protein